MSFFNHFFRIPHVKWSILIIRLIVNGVNHVNSSNSYWSIALWISDFVISLINLFIASVNCNINGSIQFQFSIALGFNHFYCGAIKNT